MLRPRLKPGAVWWKPERRRLRFCLGDQVFVVWPRTGRVQKLTPCCGADYCLREGKLSTVYCYNCRETFTQRAWIEAQQGFIFGGEASAESEEELWDAMELDPLRTVMAQAAFTECINSWLEKHRWERASRSSREAWQELVSIFEEAQ